MKHYLQAFIIFSLSVSLINIAQYNIQALTLEQKVGQLFMVAAVADEEIAKDFLSKKTYRMDKEYVTELITQYHIGGIVYLGKSNAAHQIERTKYYQSISVIPLLIGQDLEPGRAGASRLEEMRIFKSNEDLGKENNEQSTYQTGLEIGRLCKQLEVHINFAPVADVNNNPHNQVINDRSFGNTSELIATHTIMFAAGLHDAGIIACAKHFPGHGDTNVDSHYSLPIIKHDARRLHAIELAPFIQLIAANIPAIMIAHLEVPAFEPQKKLPSSLSKNIVTNILQKELGFTGLIITDALDMGSITHDYKNGKAETYALHAGNDILLCPIDVPAAVGAIRQALIDGFITEQEIDAHVKKILQIKQLMCN